MDFEIGITIALLNTLMATVYMLVANTVLRRRPQGPGRGAATAFALWWWCLAALSLGALVDFGIRHTVGWSLAGLLGYTQLVLLDITIALAALMYYLIYLYTGRPGAWKPIAVAYAIYFGAILYYIAAADPVGVEASALGSQLEYANDLSGTTFARMLGLLLILPIMIAAVAYFSLFFKAPERSQRFRIAMVAGALFVWFGSSLIVGQFTDYGETHSWRLISPLIALTASWIIFVAFSPPNWLQRRFGIQGYGSH